MDINLLVKLTSRAWSLHILALMHRGVPGRQAPLLAASGAGRTAFANSLAHLIALGLLERNPGHGHPLRPEYRLTPEGVTCAALAHKIADMVPTETGLSLLRRSWTVPVLSVSRGPRYFSQIKKSLPAITDRALSQSLQQLQTQRWMSREIDASQHPPRPIYRAANVGCKISEVVNLVG